MTEALQEARWHAAQKSGGTSSDAIKQLVLNLLRDEQAQGTLLDYGAGKAELLLKLHELATFQRLAGIDLYPRADYLPPEIDWIQQDLNEPLTTTSTVDVVVCSETIEHLENPRQVFRNLYQLLNPGGLLVLTMPNQESLRSYLGLLFSGHFIHFVGSNYPAHITALLRLDLVRICQEVGFAPPRFRFSSEGGIPKLPRYKWQRVSFGLLRGRWFSDNIGLVTRKPMPADVATQSSPG